MYRKSNTMGIFCCHIESIFWISAHHGFLSIVLLFFMTSFHDVSVALKLIPHIGHTLVPCWAWSVSTIGTEGCSTSEKNKIHSILIMIISVINYCCISTSVWFKCINVLTRRCCYYHQTCCSKENE